MKVKDLIKRLENIDPEAAVIRWGEYYAQELEDADIQTYTGLSYVAAGDKRPLAEREFMTGNTISIGG